MLIDCKILEKCISICVQCVRSNVSDDPHYTSPQAVNIDLIVDCIRKELHAESLMPTDKYAEWETLRSDVHALQKDMCKDCIDFDNRVKAIPLLPTRGKRAPKTPELIAAQVLRYTPSALPHIV